MFKLLSVIKLVTRLVLHAQVPVDLYHVSSTVEDVQVGVSHQCFYHYRNICVSHL